MAALDLLEWLGYSVAFATAMVVIAVDCNSALKKKTRLLPISVLRSPEIWILSVACGVIAAVCLRFSNTEAVKSVIDLKWNSPPGRGLLIGVGVLAIIRSKFFNFKDTDFGGEFFYNGARAWALNRLWQRWLDTKTRYTPDVKVTSACDITNFEADLADAVREIIALEPDDFKKSFEEQLTTLQSSRPTIASCADPKAVRYFRTLIKFALDYAGTKVLKRFPTVWT
jgi:hypothetical protein